jgi:hypothetical protein
LLYLVTDLGFLNEPSVVWAGLSVEGDCTFLDGKFNVAKPAAKTPIKPSALPVNSQEQLDAESVTFPTSNSLPYHSRR